jgi:hypothetical protein
MGGSEIDKGISRIDSNSTHGWFVRGYRNGKTFSRLFSDNRYGNKAAALREARAFRDQLHKELQEQPAQPRARRVVFSDARNTTGVLGVCRTVKKTPSGKPNPCYSVSWRPEPGVQKCTSFSISKYGEERAFQLAVAHRRKMMHAIHGPDVSRKMRQDEPKVPTD